MFNIVKATSDNYIDFNIVFQPDCSKDTIYFNIPDDFGPIPYYLTYPIPTPKTIIVTYI